MGIDLHNLNLLAHAQDLGVSFERSLALGRQALFVEDDALEAHRQARGRPPLQEPARAPGAPRYFEPLLQQWLGAQAADSVDASPYEQATLIHDLNRPWPEHGALGQLRGGYDAVLDFGCLEHVFDFPTAWRSAAGLCKVGGHLLHALPANNLCGHGFYQFSPELFFNLYRPAHGFELRGLWLAVRADHKRWWAVADPARLKRRVHLRNGHEVYLLVLARKLRALDEMPVPQQSDYAEGDWQQGPATVAEAAPRRRALVDLLRGLGALDAARAARERWRAWRGSGFTLPAPDYECVDVRQLVARAAR